jgi:hypothetical protein
MATSVEPEREMVRRAMPFALPAVLLSFLGGWAVGGTGPGWSGAIGAAIVFLNFAVSGLSLARAARISLTAIYGVATIGFVVRLGVIVAIMFLLNRFAFFSPLAFGLAVIPVTIGLLVFEMRLLAGGLGREVRPELAEHRAVS